MKKHLSYLFIVSLLIVSGCGGRSDRDAVKVMTFNIRYNNPQDSMNAWPNRASLVTRFIKEEKPDLLGMQEVLLAQYEYLDSVLTGYVSVGVGRTDGAKAGEMNPVFFKKERFDITRTKTFWLSETPEVPGSMSWGSSLPRIVTWMELVDKITHQHLFYFNTHFAHDSDSARVMSSKLLLAKVDSISSGFPFIISGDFNMLPTSRGYKILTGPAESIPLFRDSFDISERNPSGPMYTFNGFTDKQGTGRIDYLFVREGMKVLEHRTLINKEHKIYISDHWPVEAVISAN